jgi:uncharacterized lipoprotein YehR (DUF1307 family)
MSTSSIPMDAGRKLIIALLLISIGLSVIIVPDIIISKQNNIALTETLSQLLANEQKIISGAYLSSSSNSALVNNQKNMLNLLGEEHNITSKQLNQTDILLHEIYKGDSKTDVLTQHVNQLFNAIYNGDDKADRVLKNVTTMFTQIQGVINNHTRTFNETNKQIATITPIIVKIGKLLDVGEANYVVRHQIATYLHHAERLAISNSTLAGPSNNNNTR